MILELLSSACLAVCRFAEQAAHLDLREAAEVGVGSSVYLRKNKRKDFVAMLTPAPPNTNQGRDWPTRTSCSLNPKP